MNQTNVVDRWEQNRVRHSHEHAPPLNVNQALVEIVTPGERMADSFALVIGSWKFMIVQSLILTAWIVANVMVWVQHWDSYPFILLNLALSFQAAYAAPIIMMSQNRQAAKDRLMAEQEYLVNTKAEEEVKAIMHHLEQQDEAMIDILRRMEQQHHAIISGFAAMGFNGSGTPAPV
jgi:uncharacterized membrane protein